MHTHTLRSALAGLAVLGALGLPAIARASDQTIKHTIGAYNTRIGRDEHAVAHAFATYPQRWGRLLHALRVEVRDLDSLTARLNAERASTRTGGQARHEIAQGLTLIASAYSTLRSDVLAVHGGPVPVVEVRAVQGVDETGRLELIAGLGLL